MTTSQLVLLLLVVVLGLLFLAVDSAPRRALPDREVRLSYHFNRNSLASLCATTEGVVVLTRSGNLLRFDPETLRLERERIMPVAARGLFAGGPSGVLATLQDGAILQVDPLTLVLREIARLPAPPAWITPFHDKDKACLLAVQETRAEQGGSITLWRIGEGRTRQTTHPLPRMTPPLGAISAFHLDGQGRLWLGKDMGEWGGWCGWLDTRAAQPQPALAVEEVWSGVYGFANGPDGQVLAFGGMLHMGLADAMLGRVDRGRLEDLLRAERFPEIDGSDPRAGESPAQHARRLVEAARRRKQREPEAPTRPRFPITHILPDPSSKGFLVFAYTDLFRVDRDFQQWQYVAPVKLRYVLGRPDAMGSYPALKSIQPVGDGRDLLGASVADGLVRIANGHQHQHMIPGQLGEDDFEELLPALGGTILAGFSPWQLVKEQWRALPHEMQLSDRRDAWYQYRGFPRADSGLTIISRDNSFPGVTGQLLLRDGELSLVARQEDREIVQFDARSVFSVRPSAEQPVATSTARSIRLRSERDGDLWCAARGKLLKMVAGKWSLAGKAPETLCWRLKEVGGGGPPWTLCGSDALYRLHPGSGSDGKLELIPLPAELGKAHDGLSLAGGWILLATQGGLRLFDEKTSRIAPPPFAPPEGKVEALARDKRGRIWFAGSDVWLLEDGKPYSLGEAGLPRGKVLAMAADAEHEDGVVVSLQGRGAMFIRAGGRR